MAKNFARNEPRLKPQPKVLVICEDKKSGKCYFDDANRILRSQLDVEVTHRGKTDPLGILNEAIDAQNKYDKIYCVIDRDQHENFDEAIQKSRHLENIIIIDSHPCFEYWLILHFNFSRKPYKSKGRLSSGELCIKDLKKQNGMETYEKGTSKNLFKTLFGAPLETARKNAEKSLQQANDTDDLNPSTKIHILISDMEKLGSLQHAECVDLPIRRRR